MDKLTTLPIRTYSELSKLKTFEERFNYLKLGSGVGRETFGFDRYLNQYFYKSYEWKHVRNEVIARDLGCDMGLEEFPIAGRVMIHHMNPITVDDLVARRSVVLDPEYLVCVSHDTHNAIHYGDDGILKNREPAVRTPNDTCPWRN